MNFLEDRRQFFEDLKDCYRKEGRPMQWEWEEMEVKKNEDMDAILFYMAFSLSKDALHGPLPDHLHNRMVLSEHEWSKSYLRYLEG